MRKAVIIIVLLLLVAFGALLFLDARRHAAEQAVWGDPLFALGSYPVPLPRGYYHEPITPGQTSWAGRTFTLTGMKGTDNARRDGKDAPGAAFTLRKEATFEDASKSALILDYGVNGNALWARAELDEMVETAPDKFLVKRFLRLGSKRWYIGYLRLER